MHEAYEGELMFEREPIVGTITTQIAKIIGMRVVSGEFAPGDALPVESELCSAYGVSRTTLREAIKQLAGKRLIAVSPKIGTRVLPFSDWNLLDRDVLAWRLSRAVRAVGTHAVLKWACDRVQRRNNGLVPYCIS